jgi:hypothetical protein
MAELTIAEQEGPDLQTPRNANARPAFCSTAASNSLPQF